MDLEHSIKKAQEDAGAFEEIYDLTISRVYSYVLLRTKNQALALDVCQDIYFALWDALPNFRYLGEPYFYAFLFQIARRQIWKARKKVRQEAVLEEAFDIPDEGGYQEDYRALLSKVENLAEKERLCIELQYFSDLPFQEVAEAIGITENHAKVLHHRAIAKLRKSLKDYE